VSETVLITGGCGFVGSNIAISYKEKFPSNKVIAFDNLKRRGSELNIQRLQTFGIEFIHGDVRNREDFEQIGAISVLIEAAAEPSVLSGINGSPDYVLNTNLNGTLNCLNFAQKHRAKFIFLSTSRVYPVKKLNEISLTEEENRFSISAQEQAIGISQNGISEDFSLHGARSFYGSSKLASELMIQEYAEFYGLKAVINRCGVLTGPWQMGKIDQGVIVLWLAKHYWKKELSYIGYGGQGKQVRDILHIKDLFELLVLQIADIDIYTNEIFNIGGGLDVSVSLKELTVLCEEVVGNKIKINSIAENRQADIPLYISDCKKINDISGWKPKVTPNEIISDVFNWMKKNEKDIRNILN
jgi:CDP-paratose 2-epimerase